MPIIKSPFLSLVLLSSAYIDKKGAWYLGMVVHAYNPSPQKTEEGRLLEV